MARWLLCLTLIVAAGHAAATGLLRVERLLHASGTGSAQPSIAVDPREGFVLTWQEREADAAALKFAVIDRDGVEQRRGGIARGTDWFINGADFPSLAVLDNGDWVSFWLQKTAPDTYAYEIRMVRSRDAGRTWDEAIVIHGDRTDTEHGFVSLTPAGDDRVRAVWLDGREMADASSANAAPASDHAQHGIERMTLRSAVFNRDGTPTDERQLDALTCACCQTAAARDGERTRVVYRNRSDAEIRDIHWLQVRGNEWSTSQAIHEDGWVIAACPVNGPAIAVQRGRFAVLWPTMASGDMQLKFALDDGDAFGVARVLASGPTELGRLDLAAWTGDHWLATRVAAIKGLPLLRLALVDDQASVLETHDIATRVGGFPRVASSGSVALLAWAESSGSPGQTRIGLARITPSTATAPASSAMP